MRTCGPRPSVHGGRLARYHRRGAIGWHREAHWTSETSSADNHDLSWTSCFGHYLSCGVDGRRVNVLIEKIGGQRRHPVGDHRWYCCRGKVMGRIHESGTYKFWDGIRQKGKLRFSATASIDVPAEAARLCEEYRRQQRIARDVLVDS